VYVGQPLDTVKVKMQTFPTAYRNSMHCLVETYQQSGIAKGLYAGTVPSLAANVAENAILFVAYGLCQKGISFVLGKKTTQELNILQNATAGSCASFFSSLALCPTELVKCRLQVMKELQTSGRLTGPLAQVNHM
jgi:solute carrier family 25 ornithine transporter 2/15